MVGTYNVVDCDVRNRFILVFILGFYPEVSVSPWGKFPLICKPGWRIKVVFVSTIEIFFYLGGRPFLQKRSLVSLEEQLHLEHHVTRF
jgi:hypothetical protein